MKIKPQLLIITLIFAAFIERVRAVCGGGTPLEYQGNCYGSCPAAAPYDYLSVCFENCPWDPDTQLTYLEGSSCVTQCGSGYADDYSRKCVSDCDTDPIVLFKDTTRKRCVEMCSTNPSEFGDLASHTCLQYCTGDTWGDPDSRICVQDCPIYTFYQQYLSHRLCTSRCYANTYADLDGVCVASAQCPSTPVMYYGDDSTNLCVEDCPNDTYAEVSSQKCVYFCSLGTYGDPTTRRCVDPCPSGPPRYYGSDVTRECHLECIEGQFADNSTSKCEDVCTNNTFGDYSTRTCVYTCPQSEATFADPLTFLCVELCATGYYADNDTRSCVESTDCSGSFVGNPLSRKCVDPLDCPQNYYVYDNDKLCVQKCPAPNYWANMETRYCMTFCEFSPLSYLSWKDDTTQRCVENCPSHPRRFASNATQSCVGTCPEGTFGTIDTYSCVTTCPDGFHSDMTNNLCVSDCTTVDDEILYYFIPNTTCIGVCPEEYYADNTTLTCVETCPELLYAYDVNNTCLWKCPDGWFSDDHSQKCVLNCPVLTKFYADDSTNMCVESCPVIPDYFGEDLNDGHRKCVSQCTLTSKYADPLTRTCVSKCNTEEGYFGYQGDRRCWLTCPTGWGNPVTTKCVATCPQSPSQMFGDNLTMTCVTRCPNTTYGDLSDEICKNATDCPSGYFGDDETARCVPLCSRLLNLFGDPVSKKCVKSCPHPLYADNTSRLCVNDCNATSRLYKDPSTKLCVNLCSVMPDLYADQSTMTCVPNCPNDYYALAYNTSVTQTRKCVAMCPSSPVFFADEQNRKCVRKCANGTYLFKNSTYRGCLDYCPKQVYNASLSIDLYADNTTWTCVSVCPSGFYAFKHPLTVTIRKCVRMCEIADDKYYFAEENTRKCVTECPLFKYGTYGDKITFKCSYSCTQEQFRDHETAECTSLCTEGTFGDNTTWNCVEKCPEGTFAETNNRTCVKHCPTDYYGYTWSNTCEENCTDNWRYFADNTSWLCVKTCPEDPDYYSDPSTKQCVLLCPEGKMGDPVSQRCVRSVNCASGLVGDPVYRKCVERCTTEPMYFAMNDTKLCGPECFDDFFADNVTGFCVQICPEPYYGVNTSTYFYCVQYCPSNEFMYDEERICLPVCPDGYFADPLTMACVTVCPDNSYGNRDDNTCITDCNPLYGDDFTKQCQEECSENTTASNNSYMCQDQCDYGQYEYEQVCFSNCLLFDNFYADNLTRKCLEECPSDPLTFSNPLNQRCDFVCPSDYYGYLGNRTCNDFCPEDLFKQSDLHLCMEECPEGQFADPFDMSCVDDCLNPEQTFINPFNSSCMEICPEDPDLYGFNDEICVEHCPTGLFAENFSRTCVPICPFVSETVLNESWADDLTHRCVQRCSALSYSYSNDTHNVCVNDCPDGWFASEIEQACVENCPNGTFAHNDSDRCVDLCPDGEYGDNFSNLCVSDCSHLEQLKDDSTHMCVDECPEIPSLFAQASSNSCVLVCEDVGYFSYIENRTCIEDCPEPYFEDSSTGQCVLECPIHQQTFADEILRECVSQCVNHTINDSQVTFFADKSTSYCVDVCPEGPQRLYGVNETNTCDETCPEGTLGDNDTRLCLDRCVFESPKFTWADYIDNFCVELCPIGYFADNTTAECLTECSQGLFADNSTRRCVVTCPVSPVSYGLISEKTCIYFCPQGLYADETTRKCVAQCPVTPAVYFHYDPTNKCVTQCQYPTFAEVSSQNCVQLCQDGYYGNLTTHKCELCKTECVTCTALLECTSCASGFFLYKYECVTRCPRYPVMNFAHLLSGICYLNCPEPYFGQTNTGYCQLSCPVLYYGSLTNRTCTACPTGCFTCDIDGCYSCLTNYTWVESSLTCSQRCNSTHTYYFEDECYTMCPDGTFLDIVDLVTCLRCNQECATCADSAINCTQCAYKFFYLGECIDACPSNFFVNDNLACISCAEFPDRCILDPLSYTIEPFTENYKLHAYVIFNRVVNMSTSEFQSIVQIKYNGKAVKASEFTVQMKNTTTYQVTFRDSRSLNENSLSIGFQPGSITDMFGNHLTVNEVEQVFEAETGVNEEIANNSSKIEKSTSIFSWILLAILLLFLIKSGYPFLIAIETAQMYYMLIFVRLIPAPYMMVKFLDSLKYLHFLFLPNIFPELDGYVIDEYDTFLLNTSFLYNSSPFIFIGGFCVFMFLLFSILKSKKLCSSKGLRSVAKKIRRYRLKYMIFHDFIWITFLYACFMAMLQFSQASMASVWDGVNIAFSIIVVLFYLVCTVLMIYLGNKYKNVENKKKIPTKYSFLKMENEKFPMEMPLRFLRKFLICAALVIPHADAQAMMIVLISIMFLFYFICYMPAQSFLTNAMNIAIESSYVILAGLLYGYDKLKDKELEEQVGFSYAVIVIICLMLLAVLVWVIYRGIQVIRKTDSWAYVYKKLTENTDPEYLKEQQRKRDLDFDWGSLENRSFDDKTDHDQLYKGETTTHRNNLDEKFNIFEMDENRNSDDEVSIKFAEKLKFKDSLPMDQSDLLSGKKGSISGKNLLKSRKDEESIFKDSSSDRDDREPINQFKPHKTQQFGGKKSMAHDDMQEVEEIRLEKKGPKEKRGRAIWDDIQFDDNEI